MNRFIGIWRELMGARRAAKGFRSFARLAIDIILFRILRLVDLPNMNRERTIRLRCGEVIRYRLNRGDIQTIREVIFNETYTLPFEGPHTILVDLGAHIGLTSLWLARRYGFRKVVAVEPSASNVRLARINLSANGVAGEVFEAAVGPRDGTGFLEVARESNLNKLGTTGRQVPVMSVSTILGRIPAGEVVDLVKMDIEGTENEVFEGDLGWLDRVSAIILELHLGHEECDRLIERVEQKGFKFLALGEIFPSSMTGFVRPSLLAPAGDPSTGRR